MRWLVWSMFIFGLISVVIGANSWSNADFQVGYAFVTPAGARLRGATSIVLGVVNLAGAGVIFYLEKRGLPSVNRTDLTKGESAWADFVRWTRGLPWGERIYMCAALLFGSGVGVSSGIHAVREKVWMNGGAFGWVAQLLGVGAVLLGAVAFAVAVALGIMGVRRGR